MKIMQRGEPNKDAERLHDNHISSTLGEMGVDRHWITKHFIPLANHKLRNGLASHKLRLTETVY